MNQTACCKCCCSLRGNDDVELAPRRLLTRATSSQPAYGKSFTPPERYLAWPPGAWHPLAFATADVAEVFFVLRTRDHFAFARDPGAIFRRQRRLDVVDALPGHWLDLAGQRRMDGLLAARLVWLRRTKGWRNATSLAGRPVRLTGVTAGDPARPTRGRMDVVVRNGDRPGSP